MLIFCSCIFLYTFHLSETLPSWSIFVHCLSMNVSFSFIYLFSYNVLVCWTFRWMKCNRYTICIVRIYRKHFLSSVAQDAHFDRSYKNFPLLNLHQFDALCLQFCCHHFVAIVVFSCRLLCTLLTKMFLRRMTLAVVVFPLRTHLFGKPFGQTHSAHWC